MIAGRCLELSCFLDSGKLPAE